MTGLKLRPYQVETITAVEQAWQDGRRPAVVLPTGMGKTVAFTQLMATHQPALCLVHRDELVKQTLAKLHALAPGVPAGVVKAERNEWRHDLVVASVQTLGRQDRLDLVPKDRFDTIIVDECHHAAAGSYRRILDHFDARYAGFTATLSRGDSKGLGDVFDEVAYRKDILFGIMNGYLVDPRGVQVTIDSLDLASVARSRGDYQDGDLGRAMVSSGACSRTAEAYLEHARRPDGSLMQGALFAPTVLAAEAFAEAFNDAGIPTEVIVGETSEDERRAIYQRVLDRKTLVLASCMVLTEGFDMPQLECAVIARPTSHAGLYVQMVGRVLRPYPGKTGALVLDIVGVAGRHRLAGLIDLTETKVTPAPGEGLAAAVEREEREAVERGELVGQLHARAVDLFASSRSAWLRTAGGVMFIPTRHGYVFLSHDWREDAEPDSWLIGKTGTQYQRKGGPRRHMDSPGPVQPNEYGWLRSGLGLELAMAFAEGIAEELDPSVSSKSASWRKRRTAPSESQVGLLQRYGIEVPETKDEASNLLSIHYASRVLDRK